MRRLIRTITERQDIYIIGDWFQDVSEAFSVTDDESGFDVSNGIETEQLSCIGYAYIFTKAELDEALPYLDPDIVYKLNHPEDKYQYSFDSLLLPNYLGDIYVDAVDDNLNSLMTEETDLKDYLTHQFEDGCGVLCEVAPRAEMHRMSTLKLLRQLYGNRTGA